MHVDWERWWVADSEDAPSAAMKDIEYIDATGFPSSCTVFCTLRTHPDEGPGNMCAVTAGFSRYSFLRL